MKNKNKILTNKQWIEMLLNDNTISESSYNILNAVYEFDEHKGYANEIGLIMEFKGKSPQSSINLEKANFRLYGEEKYDYKFVTSKK